MNLEQLEQMFAQQMPEGKSHFAADGEVLVVEGGHLNFLISSEADGMWLVLVPGAANTTVHLPSLGDVLEYVTNHFDDERTKGGFTSPQMPAEVSPAIFDEHAEVEVNRPPAMVGE